MLPYLVEPPPGERGEDTFDFQHYQDHVEILQAIQKKLSVKMTMYDIYPVDRERSEILNRFLEQHQQMHNDMNGFLNLNGNDLSTVDFENKEQVRGWYYLNFQEHLGARAALGI